MSTPIKEQESKLFKNILVVEVESQKQTMSIKKSPEKKKGTVAVGFKFELEKRK